MKIEEELSKIENKISGYLEELKETNNV